MKYKNFVRGFGAFESIAGGYLTYTFANFLSNLDYNALHNILAEPRPIEEKIIALGTIGFMGLAIPFTTGFTIDGFSTTMKGLPFYGAMKTLEKITKNPESKKKIQNEIQMWKRFGERDIKSLL